MFTNKYSQIIKYLNNQFAKHHVPPNTDKNHHKSYNCIQHQNRILAYQLKIYRQIMHILQISEQCPTYKTAQNQINIQILQNNLEIVSTSQNKLKRQNVQMKSQLNRMTQILQKKQKHLKIYEDKCGQFEKAGGISRIHALKKQKQSLLIKQSQFSVVLQQQKQKTRNYMQKCKILQNLNRQTQQKLAQIMLQKSIHQPQNTKNAHNIQLLSAKQQIRQLKDKINKLQCQKKNILQKHDKKQILYSKMIIKSDTKQQKQSKQKKCMGKLVNNNARRQIR